MSAIQLKTTMLQMYVNKIDVQLYTKNKCDGAKGRNDNWVW